MTIITNIEEKTIILKTINEKQNKIIEQDVAMLDVDYSLIRTLGKQLIFKEVTLNNCGYPTIKRTDETTTTVHRFVLECYSQYDEKLRQLLADKRYEINHKNLNKQDSRICNLEIVTHQENVKHSKGLEYEVIMTSEKLQEIQQKSIVDKQQSIDKAFLKRMSGLFYKSMESNVIDEKVVKFSYCYFNFKNIAIDKAISAPTASLSYVSAIPSPFKIMTAFPTKSLHTLLLSYKQFIYKTTVKSNLSLLSRNIERYPYIRETLRKYKILDKDKPTNSLLLQFYNHVYNSNQYSIIEGNILLIISVKLSFNTIGKYKSFIFMYLLGLLKRHRDTTKTTTVYQYKYCNPNKIRSPSFIEIVPLKDDDFKNINAMCKELLNLNWNSIRYFTVAEEFGEQVADSIYGRNRRLKNSYPYSIKAKEDIINYLKRDQNVLRRGFITRNMIFDYIKGLNELREHLGANYSKIHKSFYSFISSLLLYNQDTKNTMEEKGLVYTTLNTKIINNIKDYQKQNGYTYNIELKPNMKVIVLKKLIE